MFEKGDIAVCRNASGYSFTEGKEYEIVNYEPAFHEGSFTWPEYVTVVDDRGYPAYCHAHRFVAKEE